MATLDNFKIRKTLGSGAFSKVKLGESIKGEKVALKITRKNEDQENQNKNELFEAEIKALQDLQHPNILKLVDFSQDSVVKRADGSTIDVIYMALEYAERGEIFDYIADTGKFSELEARYFFKQLIETLEYIHSQGYAHRDIKPENILLDANFNMKLADFGFATKQIRSKSRKGTFGYMAPEVLAHQEYNCVDHDLYGAAVVLFILATQHPPFIRAEPSDKYFKKIYDGNWEKFWSVHEDEHLSDEFIDMMSRMLAFNPSDRLSLQQIKAHDWYNGPVPSQEEIKIAFTKRMLSKKKKKQQAHAKSSTTRPTPVGRKLTKFYDVQDGDQLLNLAVRYAEDNGIKVEKSKEFFRLNLIVEEMGKETAILVNVLKKPNSSKRCLEFKKLDGDQSTFCKTFSDFEQYIS